MRPMRKPWQPRPAAATPAAPPSAYGHAVLPAAYLACISPLQRGSSPRSPGSTERATGQYTGPCAAACGRSMHAFARRPCPVCLRGAGVWRAPCILMGTDLARSRGPAAGEGRARVAKRHIKMHACRYVYVRGRCGNGACVLAYVFLQHLHGGAV